MKQFIAEAIGFALFTDKMEKQGLYLISTGWGNKKTRALLKTDTFFALVESGLPYEVVKRKSETCPIELVIHDEIDFVTLLTEAEAYERKVLDE